MQYCRPGRLVTADSTALFAHLGPGAKNAVLSAWAPRNCRQCCNFGPPWVNRTAQEFPWYQGCRNQGNSGGHLGVIWGPYGGHLGAILGSWSRLEATY